MPIQQIQISVMVGQEQVDLLSDVFFEFGAHAVTMTDAKDEPLFQLMPEAGPLWQHTTVHALFDDTFPAEQMIAEIKNHYSEFAELDFYIEKIAEKNWVLETQKQFQPQQFGSLWVCPEWEKSNWKKSSHKKDPVIFIEPGLAFGTGTHPTTQLCLTWLATHPLKNQTVIDYGCGSGILALAACEMGAKTVWATDHDAQALISTNNNADYNSFSCELHVLNTEEMQSQRANIVVANILANPLIELAETLTTLVLPGGQLILSGVLANDADRVAAAYENHFTRIDTQQKEEWVLMAFIKNAA